MKLSLVERRVVANRKSFWRERLNMLMTTPLPRYCYVEHFETSTSPVDSCSVPDSGSTVRTLTGMERITDGCSPLADPSTSAT